MKIVIVVYFVQDVKIVIVVNGVLAVKVWIVESLLFKVLIAPQKMNFYKL